MTDLHILSDPFKDFWKCPKKGFKKWHFLKSDPQKLNFKHLKYGIGGQLAQIMFLWSDFDKTIDQSNVNGVSWIFFFSNY